MSRQIMISLAALAMMSASACTQEKDVTPIDTATPEALAPANTEDPNIWLEEVEGEQALTWVRSQNERTLAHLEANPLFDTLKAEALEIVNSDARIPYGSIRNGEVFNFWQDKTNVRGLWRKTSLESYGTDAPEWETILDFDKLSADEGKNWVYKGANCFTAKGEATYKCMVTLSDGGKDASEQREFDLATKTFVENGFYIPEAKSGVAWVDYDTLLVATDWSQDGSTLTESGYPSIVKRWKRGTPLAEAETIFTGDRTDVGIWPFTLEMEDGRYIEGAVEADTFFTSKYFIFPEGGANSVQLPIPPKSSPVGLFAGSLFFTLQQDWAVKTDTMDRTFKSGSLLAMPFSDPKAAGTLVDPELVFEPNERQAVESVSQAKGQLLMTLSDNVTGKVLTIRPGDAGWDIAPLDLPENGTLSVSFADKDEETVFINYEGFLTPDSLMSYAATSGEVSTLKRLPAWFDASDLVVEQKEATSKDGTKIPFFVIHKKGIAHDGKTPTLLYGYGGFQVSMNPSYSGLRGKLWLERGGAFVLANIRGGGEFGPNWHQAGLKTDRQVIYDDFIAVGEWLIDHKLTSPEHLGIMGGSNGGLLMGVMLTQRPDLWNAVVVQVPLLDMLRYHLLLAGASWVDEYGSPDMPEEREWLEKMSPYHNFDSGADYPEPFFVTSTKDDRVHPAHARKMAKLFEESGKPFLYYENIDGGHSAAANLQEAARRTALEFTYLTEKLMADSEE